MTLEELSGNLFRLARKFHKAYDNRVASHGTDEKAQELAHNCDTLEKAYSTISDKLSERGDIELITAEKKALAERNEQLRHELEKWQAAYTQYNDMAVHNKLEEIDQYIQQRTGWAPSTDSQRIAGLKEVQDHLKAQ